MATKAPEFPAAGQRFADTLVSDLPVLEGTTWPYVTITGRQDGPQATVIAGVHGCEYVSIHAAQRLALELDPAEVIGRVLIVPIVSPSMFWGRSAFVSPSDGVNPNRVFPGDPAGSYTHALTHVIYSQCIAPSDAFIDLHGGDLVEELASFAGYAADGPPDLVAKCRAMASALGLDYTLGSFDAPGTVSGQSNRVAARNGIPSALAEAGGNGILTFPDVDLLVDGTRRVLQVTGNLPGEPQLPPTQHLRWAGSHHASADGFWIGEVRAGQEVKAGQRLGRLTGLLGEPLDTVEAAADAVVVYRTTSSAVKQGGLLMSLAS
jgi:uncharacterized protein